MGITTRNYTNVRIQFLV